MRAPFLDPPPLFWGARTTCPPRASQFAPTHALATALGHGYQANRRQHTHTPLLAWLRHRDNTSGNSNKQTHACAHARTHRRSSKPVFRGFVASSAFYEFVTRVGCAAFSDFVTLFASVFRDFCLAFSHEQCTHSATTTRSKRPSHGIRRPGQCRGGCCASTDCPAIHPGPYRQGNG